MYFETIKQMKKQLGQLDKWLETAGTLAETKKFDAKNFMGLRLAVDQFPFARQVQVVCDTAKIAAARLSGKDAPAHPDTEQTLEELRARIKSVIAYLDGFTAKDFEGAASADDHAAALGGQDDDRRGLLPRARACRTSTSTSRPPTRSSATTASASASATTSARSRSTRPPGRAAITREPRKRSAPIEPEPRGDGEEHERRRQRARSLGGDAPGRCRERFRVRGPSPLAPSSVRSSLSAPRA